MSKSSWIEIARAGTFWIPRDARRPSRIPTFAAIANAYDPAKRDCPLVFGHPKTDAAPAFGWAEKLKSRGRQAFGPIRTGAGRGQKIVADGHYRHVFPCLSCPTARHCAMWRCLKPRSRQLMALKAVELRAAKITITVDFSTSTEGKMPDNESQREIGALERAKLAALEKGKRAAEGCRPKATRKARRARPRPKEGGRGKEAKTAADFAAYKGAIENEKTRSQGCGALSGIRQRSSRPKRLTSTSFSQWLWRKSKYYCGFCGPGRQNRKSRSGGALLPRAGIPQSRLPDNRIFPPSPNTPAEANAASFFDASELTSKL